MDIKSIIKSIPYEQIPIYSGKGKEKKSKVLKHSIHNSILAYLYFYGIQNDFDPIFEFVVKRTGENYHRPSSRGKRADLVWLDEHKIKYLFEVETGTIPRRTKDKVGHITETRTDDKVESTTIIIFHHVTNLYRNKELTINEKEDFIEVYF